MRRENKWRAARFGIDADLVVDDAGQTRPLVEVTTDLVGDLMPIAERLRCTRELGDVLEILRTGPSYLRQRAWVAGGAGLEELVANVRRELLDDLDPEVSAQA